MGIFSNRAEVVTTFTGQALGEKVNAEFQIALVTVTNADPFGHGTKAFLGLLNDDYGWSIEETRMRSIGVLNILRSRVFVRNGGFHTSFFGQHALLQSLQREPDPAAWKKIVQA